MGVIQQKYKVCSQQVLRLYLFPTSKTCPRDTCGRFILTILIKNWDDQVNGTYMQEKGERLLYPLPRGKQPTLQYIPGPQDKATTRQGLQRRSLMAPWMTTLGPQANSWQTWVTGESQHEGKNEVWKDTRKGQGKTVTFSVEPESASPGELRPSKLASRPSLEAEVHEG